MIKKIFILFVIVSLILVIFIPMFPTQAGPLKQVGFNKVLSGSKTYFFFFTDYQTRATISITCPSLQYPHATLNYQGPNGSWYTEEWDLRPNNPHQETAVWPYSRYNNIICQARVSSSTKWVRNVIFLPISRGDIGYMFGQGGRMFINSNPYPLP